MNAEIVIPSFNGVTRLSAMLQSIVEHDPAVMMLTPITVYEDPCFRPGIAERYDLLATIFPIVVRHIPTWSNMHGAAQYAFEHARADWVVYLGDDVMITPGALTNMLHFLGKNNFQHIGLVQFPYWNAHDLCEGHPQREFPGPGLLHTKEDMYNLGLDWLKDVPRNRHWDGDGYARPYVNVNGVGFAAHRQTWRDVGGFCPETWCLDESLSVRVWTRSARGIVCLPGPPLVHYFGGATYSEPPQHDLHTEEAWIRGMKMTKAEAGRLSYAIMDQRAEALNRECALANYYDRDSAVV